MKIFFDFLHSHFRKLVAAALLTAMAGALYGLGTTLTAQVYQPLLQKQLAQKQASNENLASAQRPSYYPFASEKIKQQYLSSVSELERKDTTGGRYTGLTKVDACSYQWGVLTCSNDTYTKAINDYYSLPVPTGPPPAVVYKAVEDGHIDPATVVFSADTNGTKASINGTVLVLITPAAGGGSPIMAAPTPTAADPGHGPEAG